MYGTTDTSDQALADLRARLNDPNRDAQPSSADPRKPALRSVRQDELTTADPRQIAWQLVINGVAGGLPIPAATEIPGHYDMFIVKLPNNDQAGAWAKHLGLPEAKLAKPLDNGVRDYKAETHRFPALPGWTVYVRCFCDTTGGAK